MLQSPGFRLLASHSNFPERISMVLLLCACIAMPMQGTYAEAEIDVHALVEAAREGDVIALPGGTFELDRTLLIAKRVALVGQGRDETVLRAADGLEGVLIRIRDAEGVRLSGFTLDGAENPRISNGIVISECSGLHIEELRIRNIPGSGSFGPHALYASSKVTDSHFAHIEIRNIGVGSEWGAGIRINNGGSGNLIEQCDIAGLGRGGILTGHGSTDTVIRNNLVRDFGHAGPGLGIEVWGSGERVVIEDNTVDHWISVDGQQDVAVRRNTITGAEDRSRIGSYGLELVNSQRVVMTDNVMEGGNHIGVSVSNKARKDLAYWARNRLHDSETWGAQIQGEEGGAHRMYFHQNEFSGTRKTDRSKYQEAAGHGFRFNGNAFQIVLHANWIADNAGAGVQLGGANLDRLAFIDNIFAENKGPAVTGTFRGDAVAWKGNRMLGNQGGDRGLESKGFPEPSPHPSPRGRGSQAEVQHPALRIAITGERRVGAPIVFVIEGYSEEHFSGLLWDLGHGIPRSSRRVELEYERAGVYRIAAIAWTHAGRGILTEAALTVAEALTPPLSQGEREPTGSPQPEE